MCPPSAGALGVVGGVEWRVRLGQRVTVGSPSRPAVVAQLSPRAKLTLVHDDNTVTKVGCGLVRQYFFSHLFFYKSDTYIDYPNSHKRAYRRNSAVL